MDEEMINFVLEDGSYGREDEDDDLPRPPRR